MGEHIGVMTRMRGQDGTTLAELLVGMTLLVVLGTITTTGIVRGFRAQVAATNVATTLDGTRIATQRVRDYVRGADEVCASSTALSLVLWTDDDDDGLVEDVELDIFELITDATGQDVFQRRTPIAGGDEIQLIRDDIINNALFTYDVPPGDQPLEIACTDGTTVSGGISRTRTVSVTFTVDHPQEGEPDLTTETTVQIRNAGLTNPEGLAPTPAFTFDCPHGTETCTFDASGSSDIDGDAITVYAWDFGGDGSATGPTATASHTFSTGDLDYDVELTVVDATGQSASLTQVVRPGLSSGNARPRAAFTVSCFGVSCTFDGSGSDDDSGIATWTWDFGDGSAPVTEADPTVTHAYPLSNDYVVTLTVTDNDPTTPLTDTYAAAITASTSTMRVSQLEAVGGAVGAGNKWEATITVRLGLTTAGTPGGGITVSGTAVSGPSRDVSCSTDATGSCKIVVSGIGQGKELTFTVTQVNDPSGTFTYDADQNLATSVTFGANQTVVVP